jgi:hypothetical protein
MNLNPWKVATIGLAAILVAGGGVLAGTQLSSGSSAHPAAVAPSTRTAPSKTRTAPLFITPAWSGIKPAAIVLSADGGNVPYDLTWSQWNNQGAVGRGVVGIQSCNPNCAQGTITPVPVRITLSGVQNGHYTYIAETITGRPNPTRGTGLITSGWPFGASSRGGPATGSTVPPTAPVTQHLTGNTSD